MDVVFARLKGIIPREGKEKIKKELKQQIEDGVVVVDDTVEIEVRDIDSVPVLEFGKEPKDQKEVLVSGYRYPPERVCNTPYICLSCGNELNVESTKSDYKEVLECPDCKGKLVDKWYADKHKSE